MDGENDLMGQIQKVLSDPESMAQIQQLAGMMGLDAGMSAPEADSQPDQAASAPSSPGNGPGLNLGEMLQNAFGGNSAGASSNAEGTGAAGNGAAPAPGFGDFGLPIDLNTIMQLQGLMKQVSKNDPDAALLLALKPMLRPERQERVDKAIKLLRMVALYTAAKDSGLLQNFKLF